VYCLHEQQALAEMRDDGWPGIAVLRQRADAHAHDHSGFNLNTFLRWSHYDAGRMETLDFTDDPAHTMWRDGDFVGHCSGLAPERRGVCLGMLLHAAARHAAANPHGRAASI